MDFYDSVRRERERKQTIIACKKDELAQAQQVDSRLKELQNQSHTGIVPWCYDCKSDFRNLAYAGTLLSGCGVCWERNNFEGPPPQNAALDGTYLCHRKYADRAEPGLDELRNPPQRNIVRKSGSTGGLLRRKTVDVPGRHSAPRREVSLPTLQAPSSPQRASGQPKPPVTFYDSVDDSALTRVDDERAQQVFAKLEKRSLHETLEALVKHLRSQNLTEEELFRRLDAKGYGELSRDVMRVALRKMGCTLQPAQLDGVLRAFDTDGNGTIDSHEFCSLLQTFMASSPPPTPPSRQQHGDSEDTFYGFSVGSRVRRSVQLPPTGGAAGPDSGPQGTVVGRGDREGTVKCKFDGVIYSCKASQVVLADAPEVTIKRNPKGFDKRGRLQTF